MTDRAELAKLLRTALDGWCREHNRSYNVPMNAWAALAQAAFDRQAATALSVEGEVQFPGIKLESLSAYAKELRDIGAETIAQAMEEAAIELAAYRSGRASTPIPQAPGEEGLRTDRLARLSELTPFCWHTYVGGEMVEATGCVVPKDDLDKLLAAYRRFSPSADLVAAAYEVLWDTRHGENTGATGSTTIATTWEAIRNLRAAIKKTIGDR